MTSRCPRSDCDGKAFEFAPLKLKKSRFTAPGIRCAKCGAVVGVFDGSLLMKLDEIEGSVSSLDSEVSRLAELIER